MTDVLTVHDLSILAPGGQRLVQCDRLLAGRGAIVGLVGDSGSGKTTLLRAMTGALPDDNCQVSGSLAVLEQHPLSLQGEELREFRRTCLAYVGQDPGSRLNPRMRIDHMLAEVGADAAARQSALTEVGLEDPGIQRRRVHQLSGGQQRRVALARALVRAPSLLLLDEPTAGLDAALRERLGDLLRAQAKRGATVVIACHDHEWIDEFADEVVDLGGATMQTKVLEQHEPVAVPSKSADAPELLTVAELSAWARSRRRTPLVDDVSLRVSAGCALGVVGDSGAGKTTLARAITGLHAHVDGAVSLRGTELPSRVRRRDRAQTLSIQLVPQNPLGALNPSRTVRETLGRPLSLRGKENRDDQIAELLRIVGLDVEYGERYPHELSGGQRQRVSIARALAAEPDVIICDEVTSALDPRNSAAIMRLLAQLRRDRGLGVVIISHELGLVAEHTDDVIVLSGGRVVSAGPTAEVLRVD